MNEGKEGKEETRKERGYNFIERIIKRKKEWMREKIN